jgi:hypothetical protein
MTRYLVEYEQNDMPDAGVYGISIVESPANRMEVVALSETEQIKLASVEGLQQTLTGVVLIPNQIIPRVTITGEQYEILFSKESIVNLSRDFMKKGYQNMGTYNHNDNKWLNGITVVESWLISHETLDKAFALGFKNLPIGTWMITMKLSDDNWKQYVETGLVKGFSIDSYLPMKKIEMFMDAPTPPGTEEIVVEPTELNVNNLKTKTMNLLSGFMQLMKQHSINLASADVNGVTYYADAFEPGNIVSFDNAGTMEPLIDATFDFEGFTYTTDSTGTILTKEPIVTQEAPATEEVAMTEVSDQAAEEADALAESISEEVEQPLEVIDVEALQLEIEALKARIETIMAEKQAVLDENATLVSQPMSTRLKAISETTKQKESTLEALSRIAKQSK